MCVSCQIVERPWQFTQSSPPPVALIWQIVSLPSLVGVAAVPVSQTRFHKQHGKKSGQVGKEFVSRTLGWWKTNGAKWWAPGGPLPSAAGHICLGHGQPSIGGKPRLIATTGSYYTKCIAADRVLLGVQSFCVSGTLLTHIYDLLGGATSYCNHRTVISLFAWPSWRNNPLFSWAILQASLLRNFLFCCMALLIRCSSIWFHIRVFWSDSPMAPYLVPTRAPLVFLCAAAHTPVWTAMPRFWSALLLQCTCKLATLLTVVLV